MAGQMPVPTCQVPNSNIKLNESFHTRVVPSTGGTINTINPILSHSFCSFLFCSVSNFYVFPLLPSSSFFSKSKLDHTLCPMWFVCACCVDRCAAAIIRQKHGATFPRSLTRPLQSTPHTCTTQLCVPLFAPPVQQS